jgi:DnaJ family protein C protein 28
MSEPNFDWTGIVAERKIKEAMDAGEFDNLAGMGEPLDLDENPFETVQQRIVNRILKNSGAVPEWIQAEKDLRRETEELGPCRERGLRAVRFARNAASRDRAAARLRGDYRDRLDLINRLIFRFNYIAPASVPRTLVQYQIPREMAALDALIDAVETQP